MRYDHSAFAARNAYAQDADARIRQFLPLVRKLAWLYQSNCGPALDVDDLMQAGLIALTECVQRHTRDSDDGFAAYVKMRVRGAMIDALRSQSGRPRGLAATIRKIDAAETELRDTLGRDPTLSEIAAHLGMALEDLERVRLQRAEHAVSLDDHYTDQNGSFADEAPDACAQLLQVEDREQLIQAIGALPERLQLVIKLHFIEELNLTEIAAVLDVSVPRVHQLKNAALAKLHLQLVPAD